MRLVYALVIAALLFAGLWLLSWATAPFIGYVLYCKGGYRYPDYCAPYDPVTFSLRTIVDFFDYAGVMFTVIATGFIAWFTLTLKNSTNRLWDASERQRSLLKRSNRRQLRAYITCTLCKVADVDGTRFAEIHLKNSGQTPASAVVGWMDIKKDTFPATGGFPTPGDTGSFGTVGPGIEFHMNRPVPSLNQSELAALNAGTLVFWVWGRVDYTDAFGRQRHTPFKLFYGGPAGLHPAGDFAVYSDGNNAT